MSTKKALLWTLFWIGLALAFNVGVYVFEGQQRALEFLGGYVVELSLSMDNLFLFLLIFASFGIQPQFQRRVLNYGIFGAIILRLIFVVLGVTIVEKFHWILYVFGVILIISGFKMMAKHDENKDFKNSLAMKILGRIIPVSDTLEGEKFMVRKNGILYATPLLAVLVIVEASDVIFAIDSIPAIFSITTDPFIVYTSNIFAIMGLRSLYFLLEKMHQSFKYVKYGVALILVFTGIKLSILFFHIEIPLVISLITIFTVMLASIAASVLVKGKPQAEHA